MSSSLIGAFIASLGLVLGSFVNVLIVRMPSRESLLGRSHCRACDHVLGALDLFPVLSWVILKGRCRYCSARISVLYPIVEGLTSFLILIAWFRFESYYLKVAWLVFVVLGVALTFIDLRTFRLPDSLVFALLVFGAVILLFQSLNQGHFSTYLSALSGSISLSLFFWALRFVSRGGMGLGDVKLALATGLYLSYLGFYYLLVGTFLGFFVGAIVGIGLMASGVATRKTALPFGPFMVLGALLSLWVAPIISHWMRGLP